MSSALGAAIDGLAAEPLGHLDAAGLVELHRQRQRLEAEWLRRIAAFDWQDGCAGDGAVSLQAWLRWRLRMAPGAAREQVRVARGLETLPATAAALAEGQIGYGHARVIATAAATLPEDTVAEAEPVLVQAAREVDPVRLGRVVTALRDAVDPDGAVDHANDQHDARQLYASVTWRGLTVLNGEFDAEGGETILAALDAATRPDPAGTPRRGAATRRADALVQVCRDYLDRGEAPDVAGERPHVVVTVDLATLENRSGARGASTRWAGPICGETARRLACDAGISRIITDGASQPLDVGRRTRTVPPAIRRALVARDGGCRYPGCDRPPAWTDAHHLEHWARGGKTRLDNLVLLCRAHHRAVHEGRQPVDFVTRPPPTLSAV